MSNEFFSLSPAFQKQAAFTKAMSYRSVFIHAVYQKPDKVDFVQEFDLQLTDQIESGLDVIMLLRAGLENPRLLPDLLPYARKLTNEQVMAAEIDHHLSVVEKKYHPVEGEYISKAAEKRLKDKTESLLDEALAKVLTFPAAFEIDFKKGASENGHLVPTRQDNFRQLAKANMSSPLPHLKKTQQFFERWVAQADGALNLAVISARPLIDDPQALAEAQEKLERRFGSTFQLPDPKPLKTKDFRLN